MARQPKIETRERLMAVDTKSGSEECPSAETLEKSSCGSKSAESNDKNSSSSPLCEQYKKEGFIDAIPCPADSLIANQRNVPRQRLEYL